MRPLSVKKSESVDASDQKHGAQAVTRLTADNVHA
jgi:hypothetical protein